MKISLINQLKKQVHKDVGLLHDEVMNILLSCFSKTLVLHGGTCIWRCYNGHRFSEDIDLYLSIDEYNEELLKEDIEKSGLIINKLKKTENLIFAKISDNKTEIRVEIRLLAKTDKILQKKK